MNKLKNKINIILLVILMSNIFTPMIVGAEDIIEDNNSSTFNTKEVQKLEEQKEKKINPYLKTFETEQEADEYLKKLNNYLKKDTKGNYLGDHLKEDSVGNKYYYSSSADFSGYGDFKVYYKNGSAYKFKFNSKFVVNTPNFIVNNTNKFDLPNQLLLFCVEPLEEAVIIDGVGENGNFYNKLTPPTKSKVNRATAYITKKYDSTGNFDYLSAGQLVVWESVGATNFTIPSSLKSEFDTLKEEVSNHLKYPSFTTTTESGDVPKHQLKYNSKSNRYETTLKDTNNILSRYSTQLEGTYDKFHVEKKGSNELLIYISEEDVNGKGVVTSPIIQSTYDPMPPSGQKNGVKYTKTPTFVNSGQDLVAGLSDPITVKMQVEVKEALGEVHLKKTEDDSEAINGDDINSPLAGATFGLFKKTDDSLVEEKKTDENGELSFNKLSLGDYYIKETKAPTGYIIDDEQYDFSISEDGEVIEINNGYEIENRIMKGSVVINKVGENFDNDDNNLYDLSGAEFTITDKESKDVVDILTTDKNGFAKSENLKSGSYEVCETKAPVGYVNDNYCESFKIEYEGQVVQLNSGSKIKNEVIKGKVKLHKNGENFDNEDNNLYDLSNTEFTIYNDIDKNGELSSNEAKEDNIVEILITDENGEIESKDLKYGNYIIKETKAKEGYINGGYQEPFNIKENGEIINLVGGESLTNDVIKGKVDLKKVGDTNLTTNQCRALKPNCDDEKPFLQNAQFGIYQDIDNNGRFGEDDLIQTLTTNHSGYAISGDLKTGTYYAKELKAPEGYKINDNLFKFEITENGEIVHLNNDTPIIDEAKKKAIEIHKKDQHNNPIADVEFTIYNFDKKMGNKVVDVIKTDENGYGKSNELTYGTYLIEETSTPEGYINNLEPFTFTIDDNDSEEELTFEIENKLIENQILINKVDESLEPLAGAEFTITDIETEDVVEFTSTEETYSVILPYGEYNICEINAPEGYLQNEECISFSVSEDEKIQEFEIINYKEIYEITTMPETNLGIFSKLRK